MFLIPVANLVLLPLLMIDLPFVQHTIVTSLSISFTFLFLVLAVIAQRSTANRFQNLVRSQVRAAIQRERYRIAIQLHDSVTQLIFATSLVAEAMLANEAAYPDNTASRLKKLRQLTSTTNMAMRHFLLELRPTHINEIPLDQLIRELVDVKRSGTDIDIQCLVVGTASYPSKVHQAFYNIINLAVSNSMFHAKASYIIVQLLLGQDEAFISIEDDGVGFDPGIVKPGHFGLENMSLHARDIGASLVFDTLPGPQAKKITCVWRRCT
ncbi:MAG: hypothetical protein JXB30_04635 [Anaerolineae bacterium]|nr:hypothetical protein [Anaerolineae bacterium]